MSQTFAALAHHAELGQELLPGNLIIDARALYFEAEGHRLDFTWAELQLASPDKTRLCFTHPAHPGWTVYTTELALLDQPVFYQRLNLRDQVRAMQGSGNPMRTLFLVTAAFLVFFALVSVLVWWLSGVAVGMAVAGIPVSWEEKFGDSVFDELKGEWRLVEDPAIQARLDKIVPRLAPVIPLRGLSLKFHIVANPIPNAFAFPGGHVVIYTGVTNLIGTTEELAGVLAHELAHVAKRHSFRSIISSAGPAILGRVLFGRSEGVLGLLNQSSQLLVSQSFSRKYEREADEEAWRYLIKANIDPRGLANFLRHLLEVEQTERFQAGAIRAFSSHPPTSDRVERMDQTWRRLEPKPSFKEF